MMTAIPLKRYETGSIDDAAAMTLILSKFEDDVSLRQDIAYWLRERFTACHCTCLACSECER